MGVGAGLLCTQCQASLRSGLQVPGFLRSLFATRQLSPLTTAAASTWAAQAPDLGRGQRSEKGRIRLGKRLMGHESEEHRWCG